MLCKESRVSFCQLHCFSLFSGKCGKFVSSIIIISLFITCFTISSSAASNNLITENMTTSPWYWDTTYGDIYRPTMSYTQANGNIFSFTNVNSGNMWCGRDINLSNFNPSHSYHFSCQLYGSFNKTNCKIWVCFDGNPFYDQTNGTFPLVNITMENDSQWHNVNLDFVPSNMRRSGAFTSFTLIFEFSCPSSSNVNSSVRIKSPVLVDSDDNSGLLDSILDWLSRLYHSIVGGTDSAGVSHTGLVQGISNALTVVKTAITDKLEAVKTAIKNAIDNIQGWLVSLGEDIIDGLKSLFIPSEEFLDDFKSDIDTWLTAHFGALYQAPLLAVDFIRELLSIRSGSGVITLPDIRVEFFGHTYTILQSQTYDFNWVNNTNHVLHTFYTTYRAFTYIILILGLIHYCRNKYYQIFASMNDFAGGDD